MKKKCQIWVETVIYTLIGIAIITILLSLLMPVIEEKKDQLILQQSMNMLNHINSEIEDVIYYGIGNSRQIEINLKKGQLLINPEEDSMEFSMESKHLFSELNESISIGKITAKTAKKEKKYLVFLKLDYKNSLNLTWQGKKQEKTFSSSSTPYKITLTNSGKAELTNIDFSE